MKLRTRRSGADARVTLYEEAEESDIEELEPPPPKKAKSSTSSSPAKPKTPKPFKVELEEHEKHPPPKRWREAYDILVEQRKTIVAPVDTMGCTEAGKVEDEEKSPDRDARSKRYQTLTALMLSSQTKDPVTAAAVSNLRRNLPGGCTLESVLAASEEEIHECINKVGFWRRKTEYIQKTAAILRDEHGGDVPQTIEGLLALPGVGPKMGFLALQEAWGINLGIGVDTHVQRISNRLRWHKKQTTDPEQTRLNMQSWLPKELHGSINKLLVGFGQTICLPVGPRCDLCHLARVSGLCPSKQAVSPARIKASKAKIEKAEEEAVVKVEIEPAIVDGKHLEGEMLVDEQGHTLEVRKEEDKEFTIKHEETTW